MANDEKRIDLSGVPKETIAAVIIAQMTQVKVIADELPDKRSRDLLHTASNTVLSLLKGYTSQKIVDLAPTINALLEGRGEFYPDSEIDEIVGRCDEAVQSAERTLKESNKKYTRS